MKKILYVSNEVVSLIGYGTATVFYGWIVISRKDVLTAGLYGKERPVLFEGTITGTTTNDPNTPMTCSYHYFASNYYIDK